MFVRIDNVPRDYAWGSKTAIARLLGRDPSGGPEAELWLGAHPGSPSIVVHPEEAEGARTLLELITDDPVTALGADSPSGGHDAPRLPYLMKVLAAGEPLSLQAHPSQEQAREGFERENAVGIPLDAPNRNYKDPFHKPEMIFALSDTFDALCGFRSVGVTIDALDELIVAARDSSLVCERLRGLRSELEGAQDDGQALRGAVGLLLGGGEGTDELVAEVVAVTAPDAATAASAAPAFDTVRALAAAYPGDPGIVLSLLLNRVTLTRGEALYLPAGNIHAYLSGLGIEVMAASDNVLRGGLTPKYIDVPELLRVLDFEPLPVPYLRPVHVSAEVDVFRPDISDFELAHVTLGAGGGDGAANTVDGPRASEAQLILTGPAIAITTAGQATIAGSSAGDAESAASLRLKRGEAVFITPDEGELTVTGDATLFIAMPNL